MRAAGEGVRVISEETLALLGNLGTVRLLQTKPSAFLPSEIVTLMMRETLQLMAVVPDAHGFGLKRVVRSRNARALLGLTLRLAAAELDRRFEMGIRRPMAQRAQDLDEFLTRLERNTNSQGSITAAELDELLGGFNLK